MEELVVIVGSLGGVLGAFVVAFFNRLDRRDERRHQARTEHEAALTGYLYALDRLAAEVAALPADKPPAWLDRRVTRLFGPKPVYLATVGFQRLIVGSRWSQLSDAYTAARARLFLAASGEVLAIAMEIDDHLTAGQMGTTDEWRAAYRPIRKRLGVAVRRSVDDAGVTGRRVRGAGPATPEARRRGLGEGPPAPPAA